MMNDQVCCHLKHTCAGIGVGSKPHVSPLSDCVLCHNELLNFNPKHISSCLHLPIQQTFMELPLSWTEFTVSLQFPINALPLLLSPPGSSQQNRWSSLLLPGLVVSILPIPSTSPKHPRGLTWAGVVPHTDWWDGADLVYSGCGCGDCSIGLWDM